MSASILGQPQRFTTTAQIEQARLYSPVFTAMAANGDFPEAVLILTKKSRPILRFDLRPTARTGGNKFFFKSADFTVKKSRLAGKCYRRRNMRWSFKSGV